MNSPTTASTEREEKSGGSVSWQASDSVWTLSSQPSPFLQEPSASRAPLSGPRRQDRQRPYSSSTGEERGAGP